MRSLAPVLTACLLTSGCTAYMKAQNRSAGPRGEAGQIAAGGVAEVVVGALICVGSYYLYQHADPDPERGGMTGSHAGVAGVLLGSGIMISGIADGTIALYQLLSGDHLLAAPYTTQIKPVQGLNALVRTPLTP